MEKYETLAIYIYRDENDILCKKPDFNSYAIRHTGTNIYRNDEKLRLCRGLKVTVILSHTRLDR